MAASMAALDPRFRPAADYLVRVALSVDPGAKVTSTRRSSSEQAMLYRRYLAGLSQFPAAPPGSSKHELGLAIDIVSKYNVWLGQIWRSWGGEWDQSDVIHYSVR